MANELFITYPGARPVYTAILRMTDGYVWNPGTNIFEAVADLNANIGTYDIPLANLVGHEYAVDMPADMPNSTIFKAQFFQQAGAAPVDGDLILDTVYGEWNGVAVITPPAAGDGNYCTIAEVKAYKISGEVVDLSDYTDGEIGNRIAVQEALIESICNDIFYLKTETNFFDGSGMPLLLFPPRTPYQLVTLTAAEEVDFDGTVLTTYDITDEMVAYSHHMEVTNLLQSSSVRASFGDGVWPFGQNNLKLAGDWGRAVTPAEISYACLLLTLEALIPGSTNMLPQGVTQAIWNDFTLTLNKASDMIGEETGFPAVDRILRRNINYSDMFSDLSALSVSDGYQPVRAALGRPI